MEEIVNLSSNEIELINGGGFAYDAGAVIGFMVRYAGSPANAVATWCYQYYVR
jgi:hypothetical protein